MFTWICPQCGREVPPSYTECPDCAAKAAGASGSPGEQPPATPPPPPPAYPPAAGPPYPPSAPIPPGGAQPYPPPGYPYTQYPYPYPPPGYAPPGAPSPQYPYPPPPYPQYQQPVYGQPPYAPPPPATPPPPAPAGSGTPKPESATAYFPSSPVAHPPASTPEPPASEPLREPARGSALFGAPPPPPERKTAGMPTWLLTILCTAGFALVVIGAYWIFGSHKSAPATPSATVESPAANPGAPVSPWQKFIEVSGVRLMEDPKHKNQILAKFVVTNHSGDDLQNLAGNVTIWAGTKKSDEDAQGTFSFKTTIGPYDSKELTEPFSTKLKVYELPDWNASSADLQVTAPAGPG